MSKKQPRVDCSSSSSMIPRLSVLPTVSLLFVTPFLHKTLHNIAAVRSLRIGTACLSHFLLFFFPFVSPRSAAASQAVYN